MQVERLKMSAGDEAIVEFIPVREDRCNTVNRSRRERPVGSEAGVYGAGRRGEKL